MLDVTLSSFGTVLPNVGGLTTGGCFGFSGGSLTTSLIWGGWNFFSDPDDREVGFANRSGYSMFNVFALMASARRWPNWLSKSNRSKGLKVAVG